jgi:putative transposase
MKDIGSLSHTKWECKYHIVFIPKYRRKAMYQEIRQYLGKVFHELARQKECRIEEGHLCSDHVHMLISIPPKYAVSQIVGFMKGKSAISIARTYGGTDFSRYLLLWDNRYRELGLSSKRPTFTQVL